LPPSVEFELWWNLYCFIVRNREKIYEITSRKEPKATEELQKQLLVSNQYLLELYREYSQFWKQKSTPENDQKYKDAWKDWETIWQNEQEGKGTTAAEVPSKSEGNLCGTPPPLSRSGHGHPDYSTSFSGPSRSQNTITETKRRRFSAEYPRNNDTIAEYHKNHDSIAEYPKSNDSIQQSTIALRISSPNPVYDIPEPSLPTKKSSADASPTEIPLRRGSIGWRALPKWHRKSGGPHSFDEKSRISNCTVDGTQEEFMEPPLAVRQVSSHDLKKLEKAFRMHLRQAISSASTQPLFIEYDELIKKHLQMLFAQTKSSLYHKLTSHLLSWNTRFGREIYSLRMKCSSDSDDTSTLLSFYPVAIRL